MPLVPILFPGKRDKHGCEVRVSGQAAAEDEERRDSAVRRSSSSLDGTDSESWLADQHNSRQLCTLLYTLQIRPSVYHRLGNDHHVCTDEGRGASLSLTRPVGININHRDSRKDGRAATVFCCHNKKKR